MSVYVVGKSDVQGRLDSALQEVNDKYQILQETEKNAVRNALIEERSRFCLYISCLKPVVVSDKSKMHHKCIYKNNGEGIVSLKHVAGFS